MRRSAVAGSVAAAHRSAFRALLRSVANAEAVLDLQPPGALVGYFRHRFRQVAAENAAGHASRRALERQAALIPLYCDALAAAETSAPLQSMLTALATGVGDDVYQRRLEQGYLDYLSFEQRRFERRETDADAASDRQNRVLLHALIPLAERLATFERFADAGPDRLAHAMSPRRAGVRVASVSHGREDLVIEIDEAAQRQTIFVRCTDDGRWNPADFERCETAEADGLRGVVAHAPWLLVAQRLTAAAIEEAGLHRSRPTVVAGHRVGGAVALAMALLLQAQGFEVRNTVSFGAPKLLERVLERSVHALSPVRVVLVGDPVVELPTAGTEGNVMLHVGEILLVQPPKAATEGAAAPEEGASAAEADLSGPGAAPFSMRHYFQSMRRPDVELAYAEGDDVWEDAPKGGLGVPSRDIGDGDDGKRMRFDE